MAHRHGIQGADPRTGADALPPVGRRAARDVRREASLPPAPGQRPGARLDPL